MRLVVVPVRVIAWLIAFMVSVPGALALAFVSTAARAAAGLISSAVVFAAGPACAGAVQACVNAKWLVAIRVLAMRIVAKQAMEKQNGPDTLGTGPVGKLVAGTGFEPVTFGL